MDKISLGKLLPDIKVAIDNEEIEPGEIPSLGTESSDLNIPITRPTFESSQRIYKNPAGGFSTGLDLLSKENSGKLDRRAERFGLEQKSTFSARLNALYESMGINLENRNSGVMKNVRLDTLHIRGVNNFDSEAVFGYFENYGPIHLEWINDSSCNVQWADDSGCARALLGLSKELPNTSSFNIEAATCDIDIAKESESMPIAKMGDEQKMDKMEIDESEYKPLAKECSPVDIPVPPGYIWRLGVPHIRARTILLRFATKDDVKLPGAEKRSEYYKIHGNPNYGGLTGVISASKKQKVQAAATRSAVKKESGSTKSQSELFSKYGSERLSSRKRPLRMRMYADDEELKRKKYEKIPSRHFEKTSVHSRLGKKYTEDDLHRIGYEKKKSYEYSSRFYEDKKMPTQDDLRCKLSSVIHVKDDEAHGSVGNVKSNRNVFKRKYRSPLCRDDDDDEDEYDSEESSSA